jgi:MFS family permease
MLGQAVEPAAFMSIRERIDFAIVALIFGVLVGATTGYAVLSAQILQPYGYSDVVSGLTGAAMLLVGLLAAIVTAPLFDRVFTYQLAMACKIFVPLTALAWFSLIWVVRPNNTVALFVISIVIGVCSLPMLPIGMELSCELTRNTDGSAAIVWVGGNLFTILFVLVFGALRAGPNDSPPLNMKRAMIFQGAVVLALSSLIFLVRGEQRRKAMDEQKLKESLTANAQNQGRF